MRHLLLIAALAAAGPAPAAEPLAEPLAESWFVAGEPCPAFQSKNRRSNPGEVAVVPGAAYRVLARNAGDGEWLQIAVPDAPSATARWVLASCGREAAAPPDPAAAPAARRISTDNLLALSWQPAFCEIRPGVPECRRLNGGRPGAAETLLSIHGLWPQPEGRDYCDVPDRLVALDRAGRWDALPPVALSAATRDRLAAAMPGTASGLERHEWLRHGSCYGADGAEGYFADALALAQAVNASGVAMLFARNLGERLETDRIRAAFDRAFGRGAGRRVQVDCVRDGDRLLIQEVSIALRGAPGPETPLAGLILAADPLPPGCPGGIVDPAGLQ